MEGSSMKLYAAIYRDEDNENRRIFGRVYDSEERAKAYAEHQSKTWGIKVVIIEIPLKGLVI